MFSSAIERRSVTDVQNILQIRSSFLVLNCLRESLLVCTADFISEKKVALA